MDRNKFVWNTSFPSLTVCPHKRIDDAKLDEYMKFVSTALSLSLSLIVLCRADNVQCDLVETRKKTEKMKY